MTVKKSLRSSEAFRRFVLDQLEPLDVTMRAMFGGAGLYARGVFFGIIARDALYLKVDDRNRWMFEGQRMKPFKPYPNRPGSMNYYRVPLDVLESGAELERWARRSIAVAESPAAEPAARLTRGAPRGRPATGRTSTAPAGRARKRR